MSHNITIEGGTSVRLPTAGKYCDRDIVITAEGGAEDLNDVLTEQESLIETLKETLRGKASGGEINTGTCTISVSGGTISGEMNVGTPFGPFNCGVQDNIGAFAYKTRGKSATITDLTITGKAGNEDLPSVEGRGSIEIPKDRDSQVSFSKGYTGTVTVSFTLTLSEPDPNRGDNSTDFYLPIYGSDRIGIAKPHLQVTSGGGVYAQGNTNVGSIAANVPTPIVWIYNCETGTYTVQVAVPTSINYYFAYEKVVDDDVAYQIDRDYTSGMVTKTVRCDSLMYIQALNIKGATITDGEVLSLVSGYGIAYRTPSEAGATATVTLSA